MIGTLRRPSARWLGTLALPGLILAIAIVTGLAEPRFWSAANLQNLVRQLAPLLILVTGQLFAVVSRGLDLSIAAVMALAGVVGVLALPYGGLPLALVAMVLTGLCVGLANGLIVVAFSVSPLIVTLGMLSVARGIALLLTSGLPLYNVPNKLVDFVGFGALAGVPVSSLIAFAVMALAAAILRVTVFGRYVYAIGFSGGEVRNQLTVTDLEHQLADGAVPQQSKPLVHAILRALAGGVERVHVLDGRVAHATIAELFTDHGVGTLVTAG